MSATKEMKMTKTTSTIRCCTRPLLLTLGIALSLASAGFAIPDQNRKSANEESKPVQTLTMDDAIRTAIQNSKPLRAAAQQVSLQHGVVAERKAGFNPAITASATVTQFDEATTAQLGGNTLTLQKDTQNEVGVSASLPLDISGQIQTAVSQAHLEEISTRLA